MSYIEDVARRTIAVERSVVEMAAEIRALTERAQWLESTLRVVLEGKVRKLEDEIASLQQQLN